MKKQHSELQIIGLSYSHSQAGSYVIVLGEEDTGLKLPIIIKPNDAQYIAMKLEGLTTPRPLVYDLFRTMMDNLGGDLENVIISHILEGIFYAKIIMNNGLDSFELDCSVGDALCMALTFNCPILCSKEVLDIAGIQMDEDGQVSEDQKQENHRDRQGATSVENLEKMLDRAIENEEYEIASQLRDRIKELKSQL